MLHIIAWFIMALLYEFMNEKRNFGMKKTQFSLLERETNHDLAEFTALHGPPPSLIALYCKSHHFFYQ